MAHVTVALALVGPAFAGGVLPTPPVVSPAAWYRADMGLTLGAGGVVNQWLDQSGNGWDLTLGQGDPTFTANAVNGMPAVTFDGNDALLGDYTGEPATIFVIGKSNSTGGAFQSWAGGRTSDLGVSNAWSFDAVNTSSIGRAFRRSAIPGSVPLGATGASAEIIQNKHYLQAGRLDVSSGTIEIFKQGFLESTGASNQPLVSIDKMAVGASFQGSNLSGFLTGDINEVLIYDRVLNDSEMSQVQSYLTRWFGGDPTQNNYIAASWKSDTDQNLFILQSDDAQTFTGAYASHGPLGSDVVRDPSIMFDEASGYWWTVYTAAHFADPSDHIGLARSRDGVFWDNVNQIDTSSVASGNPRTFAPEWIHDVDGWHVVVGLSSNGGASLEMYELHPTDTGFTSWSAPEKLTGLQSNVVDGMLTKINGRFYIWYTDRTTGPWSNVLASADSITGPYTPDPELQGNWYPVGAAVEAPYVVNLGGDHWRMFFDQPGSGTKLIPGQSAGLYIDSFDGMRTWGPPGQMTSPAKRHLSIVNLSLPPEPLVGDLDGDGFVGITDLNIVLAAWNQNVAPGDSLADPSGDGFVGIEDLNVVLGNWNAGTQPPAGTTDNVPEPMTFMLLCVGGLALLHRRSG